MIDRCLMIFDNVRLYTSYLGNASNPIPLESIFMGAVFHNYKQLLHITKEDTVIDENSFEAELISLLETKPEGKVLFYRFCKKWHSLVYTLHKEDRLILLKMVLEVCGYDEDISRIINIQDFQAPIDYLSFLFALLLQQQKLIDKVNGDQRNKEITLLDFMSC